MRRRSFLRLGLAGVGGAAVGAWSACAAGSERDAPPRPARDGGRVLLAYFSRPGENHWTGGRRDLEVGNTEVLARKISARLDCDVHRAFDFTRKTVHPLTTHAMSGLGTTREEYARSCTGARIGTGLAIRGEAVRSAGPVIDSWLRRARLLDDVPARP